MEDVRNGLVILAAGASSRFGSPKQLLQYHGRSLLQHSINAALASSIEQVMVVLGDPGFSDAIPDDNRKLHYSINAQWQEGMASSIRCGLTELCRRWPGIEDVLFMACDQPFVSSEVLDKLVTLQRQTGKLIAASRYAGTAGIPAIFNKNIFPDLLQLKGDVGARRIIAQQEQHTAFVDFPMGEVDIDTPEDYLGLEKM